METYLDDDRMRLVAHSENVVGRDEPKPGVCTLKVIERLAKVSFGCEEERCKTLITIFHLVRWFNNEKSKGELMLSYLFQLAHL